MKLTFRQPSDRVVVVTADVDGQTEAIVLDTALGTRPEALRDYVSDRGGTAPVGTGPRGPGDASRSRLAGL